MKQGAPTPLMLITVFSTSQTPNKLGNRRQELSLKCLNRVTSRILILANVNHKYGTFEANCYISLVHQKVRKAVSFFVDLRRVACWQRLIARIIRICQWGKRILVLLFFLLLTFKLVYGILVEVVCCCNLRRLKVCNRLCCPDLQLHTMNFDFLHAQRFWENLPVILLVLLWLLWFRIQGLEIHANEEI